MAQNLAIFGGKKTIDVVLVRLLFSGEFNVTVPEIAKGIINKNINIHNPFFIL